VFIAFAQNRFGVEFAFNIVQAISFKDLFLLWCPWSRKIM